MNYQRIKDALVAVSGVEGDEVKRAKGRSVVVVTEGEFEKDVAFLLQDAAFKFWTEHSESAPKAAESSSLFPGVRVSAVPEESEVRQLRNSNTQLLLERERLKTKLILEGRSRLEAQNEALWREQEHVRQIERLSKQTEGQLNCIRQLVETNSALTQALLTRDAGRLCAHESDVGVVVERAATSVVIRFESKHGGVDRVFEKDQFIGGVLPDEGDRLQVHLFAWRHAHVAQGIEQFLTAQELEDVARASATGISGGLEI